MEGRSIAANGALLSHELKTPLSSIRALVDTLLARGNEDPTHEHILEAVWATPFSSRFAASTAASPPSAGRLKPILAIRDSSAPSAR